MPDPDLPAPVAKILHFAQHELPRLPNSTAFSKHLKRTLGAGLPDGADPEDACHRCGELADTAVLCKVVHGFQRKKQVRVGLICIQCFACFIKVRMAAQLIQSLFNEKGDFGPGGERVHNIDAPGRVTFLTILLCHAGSIITA